MEFILKIFFKSLILLLIYNNLLVSGFNYHNSNGDNIYCNVTVPHKTSIPVQKSRVTEITYMGTCDNYKPCLRKKNRTISSMGYEEKIENRVMIRCCKGYITKNVNKKVICVPKCDLYCENGVCSAPNVCKCLPGYQQATAFRCVPKCHNCIPHGKCVKPNVCECNSGYEKNRINMCVAKCSPQCVNSVCSAPNVCNCHDGYEKDPFYDHTCNPICSTPCGVGSVCVSPDVCECEEGYYKDETGQCTPICDFCENGKCVRPGECQCDDGYDATSIFRDGNNITKCEPICDIPCENGYCSAPNTCSCNENYKLDDTYNYICNPICDPPCENGKCINPQECQCNEGFYQKNDMTCLPCDFSNCTSTTDSCFVPKGCPCPRAHIFNEELGTCDLDKNSFTCTGKCKNSDCRIDQCICWEGYDRIDEFSCEPICQPECVYGKCIGPNKCACRHGYRKDNTTDNVCIPACKKDCGIGGTCFAPNKCNCFNGYELNLSRQCAPICKSCKNGNCIAPGQCECKLGYQPIHTIDGTLTRCEPICELPCENGECIRPNECACNYNYIADETHPHICNPICDPPCENGNCLNPHECECYEGFYMSEHINTCLTCNQTCMPNEICHVPKGCPCADGEVYNIDRKICEKLCDGQPCDETEFESNQHSCEGECINADCDVDQCICWKGYQYHETDLNTCIPECESIYIGGCLNGVCEAPNKCTCYDGFILSKEDKFTCISIDQTTTTESITTTVAELTSTTGIPTTTTAIQTTPTIPTTFIEITSTEKLNSQFTTISTTPELIPLEDINSADYQSDETNLTKSSETKAGLNTAFIVMSCFGLIMLTIGSVFTYKRCHKKKKAVPAALNAAEQETFFPSAYFVVDKSKNDCDISINA